ncbi:MAG: Nif3-like dinuclear metal center hexameric protein [Bacteroidota bacterium]
MIHLKEITATLEKWAPLAYQESYDNAGLLVGDPSSEVKRVLVSLDVTEAVVQEAIDQQCSLIVSHHPIIFKGLKKLNAANYVERTVIRAIKNDIAIYATHTNLDHVATGVNYQLASLLGLQQPRILRPRKETLSKLVSFVPQEATTQVLEALYQAGAGQIGHYKNCSFRSQGTGTFQPDAEANPHVGEAFIQEEVNENRLEVIFPSHCQNQVLRALRQAHPYEEVAYYLTSLANENQEVGSGMIGALSEAMDEHAFLLYLKSTLQLPCIRHTAYLNKVIKKVAVCGGAGSFLLPDAIRQGADILVTADLKYHDFFDAEQRIIIADIGHYESEVYTKNLITEYLSENFPSIAVILSSVVTNPVKYL